MVFKWKSFVFKLWQNGAHEALKDVVDATDNTFDNMGLNLLDGAIKHIFKPE